MTNQLTTNRNPGRSRDAIEVLRTIYWYEGLRRATGIQTAYGLERRIEPESFSKNEAGETIRNNKWSSYMHGKHTPSEAIVSRASKFSPSSRRELNHVLWHALRDVAVSAHAYEWLRQLDPEIQLIIFERHGHFRSHAGQKFLNKLERRASLDALACLTILTRLNSEQGNYQTAWELAQSTFRVLLMLGHALQERRIADALFSIYHMRVFSSIRWNGFNFYNDEYDFSYRASILHQYSRNTAQTKGREIEWAEQVLYMRKIISGDYGFDLKFILDIPTRPDRNLGPPSECDEKDFQQRVRFKDWGFNNILNNGDDRFPPPEVWRS